MEEKEPTKEQTEEQEPRIDFSIFISSLGMQALMGLGEITNPIDKKKEVNLDQAKYTIDVLQVLKEKTEGNRTEEEGKILEGLLYELRLKYVEKTGANK